jgi:hypothetical protein
MRIIIREGGRYGYTEEGKLEGADTRRAVQLGDSRWVIQKVGMRKMYARRGTESEGA